MQNEIGMNVKQLVAEIERSKREDDGIDSGRGLSVNRKVEDGIAKWDVFLGRGDRIPMTVLDSETDYRETPSADIAARIIEWWDAEWDD